MHRVIASALPVIPAVGLGILVSNMYPDEVFKAYLATRDLTYAALHEERLELRRPQLPPVVFPYTDKEGYAVITAALERWVVPPKERIFLAWKTTAELANPERKLGADDFTSEYKDTYADFTEQNRHGWLLSEMSSGSKRIVLVEGEHFAELYLVVSVPSFSVDHTKATLFVTKRDGMWSSGSLLLLSRDRKGWRVVDVRCLWIV